MENLKGPSRRFGPHTGLFIFTGLKITFVITEFDYIITLIEVILSSVTVPGLGCTLAHSSPYSNAAN